MKRGRGASKDSSEFFRRTSMPIELADRVHDYLKSEDIRWGQGSFMGHPRPRRRGLEWTQTVTGIR